MNRLLYDILPQKILEDDKVLQKQEYEAGFRRKRATEYYKHEHGVVEDDEQNIE